jgi:hypothetical protein
VFTSYSIVSGGEWGRTGGESVRGKWVRNVSLPSIMYLL